MSFLETENLTLSFGENTVLKNISLSIAKGELITLLGPSGCGKSTLLRSIAGLNAPDQGEIKIDGKIVTNIPSKKREVGMVFQSYALFPNMTVFDNIAFGLKMKKNSRDDIKRKVKKFIELTGLAGKEHAYPRELSGGQQQRVALARSLVVEPKVLLLDEPLSALDAQIRKKLQQQIKEIQHKLGITMVFVTHDQEEAMAISDRIFLMKEGEIAQSGSPFELYTRPNSEFTARFMGNYNVLTNTEVQSLFREAELHGHSLFAIRPEVFSETKQHAADLSVTGTVGQVVLLGNIVRYELKSDEKTILAETQLRGEAGDIKKGQEKTLHLSNSDIIPLR